MSFSNVFGLLAGVSLFLFGMNLMGSGLKKVAGKKLEVILYKLTSNPLKGILLGTGVTAVIQSSSATSVMVVGFVNAGMMKVKQAIGIIMGAIIGTSITGWVICLSEMNGSGIFEIISTDTLTALLAIVGIILLMFTKRERNHHIATILLGFSVLMFGISAMTDAVYPLRESEVFIRLLTDFSNPLVGVLVGLVFTAIIQSASAAVGILQTLAVTGAISFQLALPVIMGIAIGASLPVLLSALGAGTGGRRTALIYLLVDAIGALVFGVLFYTANAIWHFGFMTLPLDMVGVALLNTVFRVVIVLLLIPFMGALERLVMILVKENEQVDAELKDVERLEERFLKHPALAIEQSRIVVNSMASIAADSIREALQLFDHFTEDGFQRVSKLEEVVDTYEDKLGNYLVQIIKNELDSDQDRAVSLYLHSINDFERIGDHAQNLSEAAKEIFDKDIHFSENAEKELRNLFAAILEILEKMKAAFESDDLIAAYHIEPLEEVIDNLCDVYKLNHVERVQNEICEYDHGFVFDDILTDIERVSDHCSNLGINIRIRHGEMNERHGAFTKHELADTHDFNVYYEEYAKRFS